MLTRYRYHLLVITATTTTATTTTTTAAAGGAAGAAGAAVNATHRMIPYPSHPPSLFIVQVFLVHKVLPVTSYTSAVHPMVNEKQANTSTGCSTPASRLSVYINQVNAPTPGTIVRYELISVKYTMPLHKEASTYRNRAVVITGTPALFARNDAPKRTILLNTTRHQVL